MNSPFGLLVFGLLFKVMRCQEESGEQQPVYECAGRRVVYTRLATLPPRMRFYSEPVTVNTRGECVHRCYFTKAMCSSAVFVPSSGACHFSYWRGAECHTGAAKGDEQAISDFDVGSIEVLACIRCQDETEELSNTDGQSDETAAARLPQAVSFSAPIRLAVRGADGAKKASALPPPPPRRSESAMARSAESAADDAALAIRQADVAHNAGFDFLMPPCDSGSLAFSTYPIVHTGGMVMYAQRYAGSYAQCAQLCWRQHFCASALYQDGQCMLSPLRGVCTDGRLDKHYTGPVLIACLACGRKYDF